MYVYVFSITQTNNMAQALILTPLLFMCLIFIKINCHLIYYIGINTEKREPKSAIYSINMGRETRLDRRETIKSMIYLY